MRSTIIVAALFAAFAAAAPAVDVEARQEVSIAKTVRVQFSNDAVDAAAQAEIQVNSKVSIQSKFGNLGNPVQANRALVVGTSGSCQIFKDAAGKQLLATIKAGGADAKFGKTNLGKGVIVCK